MRRLLFVAFWVPPRKAVGSIRAAHIMKHLPKFGWDVTVLTPRLDCNGERLIPAGYIQTGYCDVKRALKHLAGVGDRSVHEVLNHEVPRYGHVRSPVERVLFALNGVVTYPDDYVGWLPYASHALQKAISRWPWDAVLTSSPPVTGSVAAALAHRRIPWVADFRDLWAENDYFERSGIREFIDDKLERICLGRAAALTAASEPSAARLRNRYPDTPCIPVATGYDTDDWNGVPFGREARCTLLYAGTFYRGKRDPTLLFVALRELLNDGLARTEELRVDFYAQAEPWLRELIQSFDLQDVVRIHGFIERRAVLEAERRANRLIVLAWDGPWAAGVVAGKLFEYFGARRPIIALGGPERFAVEDLLHETRSGVHCRTKEEVKAEILLALAEHRAGTLRSIDAANVRAYDGEACARKFAEVLELACTR